MERITIAAPTATFTDVISPFVASLSPKDPVVDVRVADGSLVTDMLRDGADLAIGTQRPQRPLVSQPLARFPVWAYVPPNDPWSDRHEVTLAELLSRPLIALPPGFAAREALESATMAEGTSYSTIVEAANGTIAQALAASGRGTAVVTDDQRYGLNPLRVNTGAGPLTVQLIIAWDSTSVAAPTLESLAGRVTAWVAHNYEGS